MSSSASLGSSRGLKKEERFQLGLRREQEAEIENNQQVKKKAAAAKKRLRRKKKKKGRENQKLLEEEQQQKSSMESNGNETTTTTTLDLVLPDILCILHSNGELEDEQLHVYAINTSSSDLPMKLVLMFTPPDSAVHFVGCGPNLYLVGGSFDRHTGEYRKVFQICNLGNWKAREMGDFHWEDGPKFEGGKPLPKLFVFNGKIYALAGDPYIGNCFFAVPMPNPLFEVYDTTTRGGFWRSLPRPPFHALYTESPGPRFRFSTLVDNHIYVCIKNPGLELYSFNVCSESWTQISSSSVGGSPSCNLIYNNMNKWKEGDLQDDMILYCTHEVEVYALDLAAKEKRNAPKVEKVEVVVAAEEEVEQLWDSRPAPTSKDWDCDDGDDGSSNVSEEIVVLDSDYFSEFEEASPCDKKRANIVNSDTDDYRIFLDDSLLPVHGLKSATSLIYRDEFNIGFVAHLDKDVYCLVYYNFPSPSEDDQRVNVCTFRAVKQQGEHNSFVQAKIWHKACHSLTLPSMFVGQKCVV